MRTAPATLSLLLFVSFIFRIPVESVDGDRGVCGRLVWCDGVTPRTWIFNNLRWQIVWLMSIITPSVCPRLWCYQRVSCRDWEDLKIGNDGENNVTIISSHAGNWTIISISTAEALHLLCWPQSRIFVHDQELRWDTDTKLVFFL